MYLLDGYLIPIFLPALISFVFYLHYIDSEALFPFFEDVLVKAEWFTPKTILVLRDPKSEIYNKVKEINKRYMYTLLMLSACFIFLFKASFSKSDSLYDKIKIMTLPNFFTYPLLLNLSDLNFRNPACLVILPFCYFGFFIFNPEYFLSGAAIVILEILVLFWFKRKLEVCFAFFICLAVNDFLTKYLSSFFLSVNIIEDNHHNLALLWKIFSYLIFFLGIANIIKPNKEIIRNATLVRESVKVACLFYVVIFVLILETYESLKLLELQSMIFEFVCTSTLLISEFYFMCKVCLEISRTIGSEKFKIEENERYLAELAKEELLRQENKGKDKKGASKPKKKIEEVNYFDYFITRFFEGYDLGWENDLLFNKVLEKLSFNVLIGLAFCLNVLNIQRSWLIIILNLLISAFCFSTKFQKATYWDYFNMTFFGLRFLIKSLFESWTIWLFHQIVKLLEFKYLLFNMISHLFTNSFQLKIHSSNPNQYLEPEYEKNLFPLEKAFGGDFHNKLLFYSNPQQTSSFSQEELILFFFFVFFPVLLNFFHDRQQGLIGNLEDSLRALNKPLLILIIIFPVQCLYAFYGSLSDMLFYSMISYIAVFAIKTVKLAYYLNGSS